MKLGRILLAFLISLSVAVLPAAGGFGAVIKSTETTEMASMADMDCCPDKANPCDKAMDDCPSMATCALKCFTFSSTGASPVVFPVHVALMKPPFWTEPFDSQKGSPPFRPPRV